jgi:hypothetical protein
MNAEQKIKHQQDLSKARSKSYYKRNKEKILEKRKTQREAFNKQIQAIKAQKQIIVPEPIDEPIDEPIEPVISLSTTTDYTKDDIINLIKQQKYEADTAKTYITDTRRIFKITGCKTIIPCLKKTQILIDEIKKGTYRGELYSINTLKQTFQILVIIIDKFLINNTNFDKNELQQIKDKINIEFDRYKELSKIETEDKIYNGVVPSFKQYLTEVKQMFGEDSKHYVVALLYSIFTMRDNFKAMKIIENETENNGKSNFLLYDGNIFKIIINTFKTKKKYKTITYTNDANNKDEKELKQRLEKYISSKKIKYGSYIFGKAPLSDFVSKMNAQMGYETGINLYRHMRVTEEHGKALSFEERNLLANQMGHSLATQKLYKRNIIEADA